MCKMLFKKLWLLITPLLALAFFGLTSCSIHPFGDSSSPQKQNAFFGDNFFYTTAAGNTASSTWLAGVMDKYHNTYDVYSDSGAGGNNFVIKALMENTNITMVENNTNSPYSGDTAIKVTFNPGAPGTGNFMTGTLSDGTNMDTTVITINSEAMPLLALLLPVSYYTNSLKFADANFTNVAAGSRYDYNTDKDGAWMEGTGYMALAYLYTSNLTKGTNIIHFMTNGNVSSYNGLYASSKNGLTTGYVDASGSNLMVYRRIQVAATAMSVFAGMKINPFWIGTANSNLPGTKGGALGTNSLRVLLDQYHTTYYVYKDANCGGNHFDQRGLMNLASTNILTYTEYETNVKYSGVSSIKVTLAPSASSQWVGMYYMNGVLTGTNRSPTANWGNYTNAGNTNLIGATTLSFYARGASGNEVVTFFTLGIGRNGTNTGTNINPDTGLAWKYPDSNPQVVTNITLSNVWKLYTISLSGKNLSYVLGGFGWSAANQTTGNKVFYIDQIYINKNTATKPRLIETFTVANSIYNFDQTMANMAYTYDNSLAALAFLATGDTNRAKYIIDALIYAQTNDRYFSDNRLRNAYMSGDLYLSAGWCPNADTNTARAPGWWDNPHYNWYEDATAAGSSAEANAWAMLAMLGYYGKCGGAGYLDAAQKIANWVEGNLRDSRGNGGYKNGFIGWEPTQTADLGKNVMANAALYTAFQRLYIYTGNTDHLNRANWAKNYVLSMWSAGTGFYFMNGQLPGSGSNMNQAIANWGTVNNAGINLSGATKLDFYAKGAAGGEKVEFFMGGVGRKADGTSNASYPDSTAKVSTGVVTLSSSWTKYTIDLTGKNLNYVLGGFGFYLYTSSTNQINFYLDDIKYDKARLSAPRFLVSFMADERNSTNTSYGSDRVLKNNAFIYDNAMAVLAFLVVGENTRAQQICDAFVYARTNDRYYTDGRLRNAYTSGELYVWPGWYPNAHTNVMRMPGWWDSASNAYFEDRYAIGTATGNLAWAMIALISYYQKNGGSGYLNTAIAIGDWIYTNMYSAAGKPGFRGGYDGWEPSPSLQGWKSTEHNLDLYAAYKRLYDLTGTAKWNTYAGYAYTFVTNMWQPGSNWFYTGTTSDGATIDYSAPIPLDTQVWTHLALHNLTGAYTNSLFTVTNTNGPWYWLVASNNTWGFDFDKDHDGMWFEGTGQVATAFMLLGMESNATRVWNAINTIGRQADNGIVAATKDGLTTGFECSPGIPWYYYKREAVAPTAWAVMVEKRVNAYYIGSAWEAIPIITNANTNTYGIFTETQAHSNTGYLFSGGGALAFWNGCGAYYTNATVEGTNCWTVNIWVTDWFGWGAYNTATNMSAFSGGFLCFKAKSSIATPLKVGIKSTGQEAWVNLADYGFVTNGTWQTLSIPMSAFSTVNPSLSFSAIEYFFMMAQAGSPVVVGNYLVDDIYWGYTY